MNRKLAPVRAPLAFAVSALLASCSASYVATKVEPKDINTSKPGIYYSLPKTELLVVVSVKKTSKKAGVYGGDAWDDCVKKCYEGKDAVCPLKAKEPEASYELTSVKSYSRVIADPHHLYHVDVDLKAFAAFSHTFKLSNEGILTSSSSEIENKAAEVAIDTSKAVLSLVLAAKGVVPPAPPPPAPEDTDPKARAAAFAKKLALAKATPACMAFDKDYKLQDQLTARIQTLRDSMDAVLFTRQAPEGPAIEQLVKRHEARVSELKATRKYEKLMEHRAELSKEEALGDYAVVITPEEFLQGTATETMWKSIQGTDTEGFAGVEVKPAKESEIDGVLAKFKEMKLTVSVDPTLGFCPADNADTDSVKPKTGYRYRFPAAATIAVSRIYVTEDEAGKASEEQTATIGKFRTLVAQYGAVTAMPSKITGVKSKIALDLYESTGSPRQIDVGATPLPSNTVGDALAPIQAELERRTKEKQEKKKEAENAEEDDLTKQRDLLKLKKEIGELEKALKQGDEKTDDSTP